MHPFTCFTKVDYNLLYDELSLICRKSERIGNFLIDHDRYCHVVSPHFHLTETALIRARVLLVSMFFQVGERSKNLRPRTRAPLL